MEQKLIHNVEIDITQGFNADKRQDLMKKHPIQQLQDNYLEQQEIQKLQSYQSNFGFHLPFKMMHERQMLSNSRRLPGEKSSLLGLEIHMNRLESLDVQDYMGTDQPLTNQSIAHTVFLKQ